MSDARKVTAYCGLCCLDCIPNNHRLLELVKELAGVLDEVGFEEYAAHKSRREPIFNGYPAFRKVLDAIPRIECSGSCYEGPVSELGCARDCSIRRCAIGHDFAGCWECDEVDNCDLMRSCKGFHPGLESNLRMIREHGIENWLDKRGIHYWWDSHDKTDNL
ncbi:MAG: DUF3795 domain-containing protein [Armatimonadota bacterium]